MALVQPSLLETSAIVIQHLRLRGSSACHPPPIAHFFCSRDPTEPGRSDPREILRSLVKQLSLTRDKELVRTPLVEEYRKRRQEANHIGESPASLSVEECIELICELGRTTAITLVIDALDECSSLQRAVILKALEEVRQRSRDVVKIFLSSRYEDDIAAHVKKRQILSVTSKATDDDLKRFVAGRVSAFMKRWSTIHDEDADTLNALEKEMVDTLVTGAQGM